MKIKVEGKKSKWAGADIAFERLRWAEGEGPSVCGLFSLPSLRDIAGPIPQGPRQPTGASWNLLSEGTKRECL